MPSWTNNVSGLSATRNRLFLFENSLKRPFALKQEKRHAVKTHFFDPKNPKKSPENGPSKDVHGNPFVGPVLEYKNANGFRGDPEAKGISITGGYVYRGAEIPQLKGKYVFADWTVNWALPMGAVYYADMTADGSKWTLHDLPGAKLQGYVTAFGEDADGELYLLSNKSNGLSQRWGKVFKLVAK